MNNKEVSVVPAREVQKNSLEVVLTQYAPKLDVGTLAYIDQQVAAGVTHIELDLDLYGAIPNYNHAGDNAAVYFDLALQKKAKYDKSKRVRGMYEVIRLAPGSSIGIVVKTSDTRTARVLSSPASHWVILKRTEPHNPRQPNPRVYFYRGTGN